MEPTKLLDIDENKLSTSKDSPHESKLSECHVRINTVLKNIHAPLGIESPPNATYSEGIESVIYVVEQNGKVLKVVNPLARNPEDTKISTFLDLSNKILPLESDYDERGLLGLAFHPDFGKPSSHHEATSSRSTMQQRFRETVFVFYSILSKPKGVPPENYCEDPVKLPDYDPKYVYYNCLARFDRLHSDGTVDLNSETKLLVIQKKNEPHNGGRISFGPDGMLYIAVGDGGPQMDPYQKAQDLSVWFGKILRIDVSTVHYTGTGNARNGEILPYDYAIPKDNPFISVSGARPEIWAYGQRNLWSLCWDPKGRFFTGDVGYNDRESVKMILPSNGTPEGRNYGWPFMEGSLPTPWTLKQRQKIPDEEKSKWIPPIYEYDTPDPVGAIIGGYAFISPGASSITNNNNNTSNSIKKDDDDDSRRFLPLTHSLAQQEVSSSTVGGPRLWYLFADMSGILFIIEEDPQTFKWSRIFSHVMSKDKIGKYVRAFGKDDKTGIIYMATSDSMGPKGTTGQILALTYDRIC